MLVQLLELALMLETVILILFGVYTFRRYSCDKTGYCPFRDGSPELLKQIAIEVLKQGYIGGRKQ